MSDIEIILVCFNIFQSVMFFFMIRLLRRQHKRNRELHDLWDKEYGP